MKLRKFSVIFTTLILFALSIYLAFTQGGINTAIDEAVVAHLAPPTEISPVIYTGIQADLAIMFSNFLNTLMSFLGNNIMLAVIVVALLVELILLYPSVSIQLKQKKIHIFHKKLVDRFNHGEITLSDTQHELNILYAVNEKIHSRGAMLVTVQIILFLIVLWGLNLMVNVPSLLDGSWSIFNISLLTKPEIVYIPMLSGLIYFVHSLTKLYYKEREDYISPGQTRVALLITIVSSGLVYWFSSAFALLLTVYFVTAITFSTVRYIIVEQHAQSWGRYAQQQLIQMLRTTELHRNKFEYISRKWNHLPIVRHINFHLLEEALSMTLGLILALNFFGVFV